MNEEKFREVVEKHQWSGKIEWEWSNNDNTLTIRQRGEAESITISGDALADIPMIFFSRVIELDNSQRNLEVLLKALTGKTSKEHDEDIRPN